MISLSPFMRGAWLLSAAVFLAGCGGEAADPSTAQGGGASPDSEKTVRAPGTSVEHDFAEFKQALRDRDGVAAASLTAGQTIAFYENGRKLALDSSSVDFKDLPQFDVLLIFQLRYMLDRETLESMSGREVFIWGVEAGIIGRKMIEPIEIHRVQHEGDRAYATVTVNGRPAKGELFEFAQQDGRWKIDLSHTLRGAGQQLDAIRDQTGKTKVELAVFLLEQTHGTSIPPEILDGPLRDTANTDGGTAEDQRTLE